MKHHGGKHGASAAWLLGAGMAILSACQSRTAVADGPLEVLLNPAPIDYPSTNAMPNAAIANVVAGQRLKVVGEGYGKDFKYFEVVLPNGSKGYLIYGQGAFQLE